MFDHKIVGFDVRKAPILDLGSPKKLGEYWPSDGPEQAPYPPTITEYMWPRSNRLGQDLDKKLNGLNLMWLPEAQFIDHTAISVAFSVRNKDAEILEKQSWPFPIPETYLLEEFGWVLLGYDIGDHWLGFSGFYGFGWKPGELSEIIGDYEVIFNRHGLLDHEKDAVKVSERLMQHPNVKQHAPFYPVRVWIQKALRPSA